MNVAVGNEASRVARLYGTELERCVGRLWWQDIRDVRALNVLVMQGRGIEHGVLAGCTGSIDVHRQPRAISHGDTDVALLRLLLDIAKRRPQASRKAGVEIPNQAPPARLRDYVILLYDRKV